MESSSFYALVVVETDHVVIGRRLYLHVWFLGWLNQRGAGLTGPPGCHVEDRCENAIMGLEKTVELG